MSTPKMEAKKIIEVIEYEKIPQRNIPPEENNSPRRRVKLSLKLKGGKTTIMKNRKTLNGIFNTSYPLLVGFQERGTPLKG